MIKTKSVSSPIDRENDGLRILVTRSLVRYLPKERYDVWMANLGPSEALLDQWRERTIAWKEFEMRYRAELLEGGSIDERNQRIKNHGQKFTLRLLQRLGELGNVTLLCHCGEEERQCHRHLLQQELGGKF